MLNALKRFLCFFYNYYPGLAEEKNEIKVKWIVQEGGKLTAEVEITFLKQVINLFNKFGQIKWFVDYCVAPVADELIFIVHVGREYNNRSIAKFRMYFYVSANFAAIGTRYPVIKYNKVRFKTLN